MRNALAIPVDKQKTLIIASDNSGAIGMKANDRVRVPYETVSYYSFRVAAMECISAGGEVISVVLQNFCGNEAWEQLVKGINKGLEELGLQDVSITGSTESNFSLLQSAIGLMVVGKRMIQKGNEIDSEGVNLAVVGIPLVGHEVIEQEDQVVPLSIFQKVSKLNRVITWPVGSKGILYELQQMLPDLGLTEERVKTAIDVHKSSGPATCFLAAYRDGQAKELAKLAGNYLHPIIINED